MIEVLEEIKEKKKAMVIDVEPYKDPLKNLDGKVNVILLLINNPSFQTETKPYNLKIFGKSMVEWISASVEGYPLTKVECGLSEDFLPIVKALAKREFQYTVVLYSDTPLLQRKTFLEVLDYVRFKQPSVLKLTRGYVFETDYLFKIDRLSSPQTQYFEEEDFITAYNLKQVTMIGEIFKNRILSYHMKQGVQILDPASTFVDADVQIGANVVIYPNNHLIGKTVIEEKVTLLENNRIENSVIFSQTQIQSSVISNSVIKNNCTLHPFCVVENKSVIEEGCTLNSFCVVNHIKVDKFSVVPSFSNLKK